MARCAVLLGVDGYGGLSIVRGDAGSDMEGGG